MILCHNVNVYEIIIIESTTWQVSFYTNKIVSNSSLVTAIIECPAQILYK